jgi:hypothetical protein
MHHRGIRRHQAQSHMMRRLKEHLNQHYRDMRCPCVTEGRRRARFKEQPQLCSRECCGNPRRWFSGNSRFTMQELRASQAAGLR